MGYTIKEVSEKTGLTIATLRYYDSMGLLPGIQRTESGYRSFSDGDLEMLDIIDSFKQAGFKIKDIQGYIALAMEGDSTLQQRYEMFLEQERVLEKRKEAVEKALAVTRKKISYYRNALEGVEELPPAFDLGRNGEKRAVRVPHVQ